MKKNLNLLHNTWDNKTWHMVFLFQNPILFMIFFKKYILTQHAKISRWIRSSNEMVSSCSMLSVNSEFVFLSWKFFFLVDTLFQFSEMVQFQNEYQSTHYIRFMLMNLTFSYRPASLRGQWSLEEFQ